MGNGRRRLSVFDSSESDSEESTSSGGDAGNSDQHWVLCDRCSKWRRIPAAFAHALSDDNPWYCENNPNKAFASCSVPQELTDEEIDADAGSDGAGEDDHDEESLKRRRIPAVWQLLKDNVLAHRKRKVQDEDDIMICHCKPVYRGGDGCGPDCINRMLCIECVPGFCPSEDKCTNQMFSKRMYANLEIRRAGAKGFGLFALEDIKAGQFVIEYIGEVLEEDEYQRRKDYYASVGQRHYYFMNIGNGEVIDACRKGNISRFINHSCEPNCETQKWLVHGELAIGLFAVRDIPKDTELTFDYNFERYGDKPMRCYCGSTNCRKFIGGMQDNIDVSLLPAVEPDNASHDLPPIMLTDADMDPNMRMLVDWRVGAKVDKAKEMGMVTRLERVCKTRGIPWTVKHFYGQEPLPAPQQQQSVPRQQPAAATAPVPASSVRSSGTQQTSADVGFAPAAVPAPPKAKQQRKAEKVAAGAAAAAGATGKGKAAGTSTATQQPAGVSKLRIEDGAGGTTPAAGTGQGAAAAPQPARPTPAAAAPSATPEVAQIRGPKALFKQWKIMQQQDSTPAPVEKPAATPSSPPSPRSPHSPPSPQSPPPPPSPRSSLSLDNDDAALDELRNTATEAARHVPLRKRLKRLPPKPPVTEPPARTPAPTTSGQNGAPAAAGQAAPRRLDSSGAGSGSGGAGAAANTTAGTSSTGVPRKNSFTSAGGAAPAAVAAVSSYSPPRSTSPPPSTSGRGAGGGGGVSHNRRLRSEIDRRLEEVVGSKGGIKDPSRQNIIKVLRLFNLCDIGSHPGRPNGFGSAAGGRYITGRNGEDSGMAGPGPGSSGAGGSLTARQRARMADLSLLLDVVLKTTSTAAKKELVACGLLTQLHQAMGRNTGKEYCVILRKVLRAVEGLPLEANDVYAVRSAHGNFADMLKQLSNSPDYDVRTKASALLKKFPPSAVTDQRLLQLMAAPPVRFGHGRGGGMRGGGGFGMPMGMQQQMLQQQQLMQQQLMKQQQMLRLKDEAAGGGSVGLPPPPPLGGADGVGGGAPLRRTSSTASMGEEFMDADQPGMGGQNGLAGLPPLGPGRQRAMVAAAAAAALASRPGLFRSAGGRAGLPSSGSIPNGMAALGMGRGGSSMLGMGASSLSFPQRPPSPANADSYASAYNAASAGDDRAPHSTKRRKFSHPHGLDSPAGGDGSLPGPPPRPPYSLASAGYHHHRTPGAGDSADGAYHRDFPGASPLPSDLPLPPPPPLHGNSLGRGSSVERDVAALEPVARLSVEELFAIRKPLVRPPPLPSLMGRLQLERHVHGELTDVVVLFALGLYGSYATPADAAAAAGKALDPAIKPEDDQAGEGDEESPLSPIIYPEGIPMSPILEPPPPPQTAAATTSTVSGSTAAPATTSAAAVADLPLPPPPPISTALDSVQLRPLRVNLLPGDRGAGPGPSPYHQHGLPAPYDGWDSVPGTATAARGGAASTTSTPTVSGLGSAAQHGAFGPPPASSTAVPVTTTGGTVTTTVTTSGLPPVVPVSSLSDWRMPPAAPANGDAAAADALPAGGSAQLSAVVRVSPHATPEHHAAAGVAAAGSRHAAASAEEAENIDEWLRPVSTHHADVWDEPNTSFEAYVADMVRHRLGKYMQPEHPSRVSVQEATMLRAKVYGEVVAKERRAWEERRRAGVYKPIERHKLEANLKEFVRSTIKRMRDREKEKAAVMPGGAPTAGGYPGHGYYSGGGRPPSGHPGPGSSSHHHSQLPPRYSLSTPHSVTPPPQGLGAGSEGGAAAQYGTHVRRLTASPEPDGAVAATAASGLRPTQLEGSLAGGREPVAAAEEARQLPQQPQEAAARQETQPRTGTSEGAGGQGLAGSLGGDGSGGAGSGGGGGGDVAMTEATAG